MPSARKRKSISSSGGNTLLSYFAPGTTGAGSSNGTDIITTAAQSPSAWKKPKVERNSVSPFDGKENRFWPGLEGGGGKGTREEPIEIMPDEDDDDDDEEEVARVVEEVSVKEDIEVINLDVEEKTSPSSSTAEDPLPLRDCTPPPAPDPPPTLTSQTADPSSFALRDVPDIEFGEDEWEMGDDELVPAEVGTEYGGDDGDGDRDAVEEEGEDIGDFEDEGGVEGAADEKDGEGGEGTNDLGCPICGTIVEDLNKLQLHVNACLDSPPCLPSTSLPKPTPKRLLTPLKPLSTPNFSLPTPAAPPLPHKGNPSAFSVLMSQHKDSLAWAQAELDERGGRGGGGRRKAPFYKVLQGMPIAVDAFRYGRIPGVTAYCLTHAHSDHYTNLSSSWKHGPIYCSQTTANLIKLNLSVPAEYVKPLPLDTPTTLPNTGGVQVTLIEANHCPGSVLFLFLGPQTCNAGDSPIPSPFVGSKRAFRYLHCGDFRACPRHATHPDVRGKRLDLVYLDTTYLNPRYCFPPQPQVVEACARLAKRIALGGKEEERSRGVVQAMLGGWFRPKVEEDVKQEEQVNPEQVKHEEQIKPRPVDEQVKPEPVDATFDGDIPAAPAASTAEFKPAKGKTLVAIGTYSIGKERIVKAIALALGSKIYCDALKRSLLLAQDDPELHAMLTSDPYTCQVHLLPLQNISVERMQEYLAHFKGLYDRVLGFRPTGWTYVPPAGTDTIPDVGRVIVRDQKRMFDETGLKPMRGASLQYMLYGVPYSEHSSFFELTCFALSVDVGKIIATVNVGSSSSRGKMSKWFEKWEAERKRRRNTGETIVQYRTIDYW